MKFIRILSFALAALTVLTMTLSCAKVEGPGTAADTTSNGEETTSEPFSGKKGNYSGAKYMSVADTSVKAADVYKDTAYGENFNKYRQDAAILDGFFDKLTQKLLDGEESGVVSPVNIYMALSLLAECTDGDTRKEILDAVGLQSIEQLREQSKRIWLYNSRDNEYGKSIMGNSVWMSSNYPAKKACADYLNNDHYASVFCGDFKDNNYILAFKQWLSDQTNGLLDDCIKQLEIDPGTSAVLASTLYYKARWFDSYYDKSTGVFNGKSGVKNCEYNVKKVTSDIYTGEGFTVFRDELSDGNSVWFFLPDENKTVSDILKTDLVSYINSNKESKIYRVTVSMPDFDVMYNNSIIDKLMELGIVKCTTGDADFSPLLDGDHYLSQVIHAARFKADKEGVEGAAYTVMMLDCAIDISELQNYDFTLDRPFVFVTENGGIPLFVGTVNEVN